MLRNEVWAAAGLGPHDGVLCLADIERRLGRELRAEDFKPTNAKNRDLWCGQDRMYPEAWLERFGTPEQLDLWQHWREQRRIWPPLPAALVASLRRRQGR